MGIVADIFEKISPILGDPKMNRSGNRFFFGGVVCNIRRKGIPNLIMEFYQGIPTMHLIPYILRGFIVEFQLLEV
jgi:hypothetical protein